MSSPSSSAKVAPEAPPEIDTPKQAFTSPQRNWEHDKTDPQILLRRGAETGNCDLIRHAVQAGADVNFRDNGAAEETDKDEKEEPEPEKSAELGDKYKADGGDEAEKKDDSGSDDEDEKLTHEQREKKKLEQTKKALQNIKNLRFNTLDSSLHLAAENGHADAVELLISFGADVDIKNRIGSTPLHTAVSHGHISVVERLLKLAARMDTVNKLGCSVFHLAVYMQSLKMLRILFPHVKDPKRAMNQLNLAMMRPIDYALPKVRDVLMVEFPALGIEKEDRDAEPKPATASASKAPVARQSSDRKSQKTDEEPSQSNPALSQYLLPFKELAVLHRRPGEAPPDDGDGLLL